MQGLLVTLLFLNLSPFSGAKCLPTKIDQPSSGTALNWPQLNASQTCLNLSGRNLSTIHGQPGPGSLLKELDLSYNHLRALPPGLLNHTELLEHVFLQNNHLSELPPAFFERTRHLKRLRLEGNPLSSVPSSVFRLCLEELSMDCECGMVMGITSYCQVSSCPERISCRCLSHQSFLNITDFNAQQCQGLPVALYAAIIVAVLGVLLAAAVGCVVVYRKTRSVVVQEKRESNTSSENQPRYISHGSSQVDPPQDTRGHADYENVFIGPLQEAGGGRKEQYSRKQPKSRSHRKVQEDEPPLGEQPIYANTQEVYYNCAGTLAPPEEDLYIMPDQ